MFLYLFCQKKNRTGSRKFCHKLADSLNRILRIYLWTVFIYGCAACHFLENFQVRLRTSRVLTYVLLVKTATLARFKQDFGPNKLKIVRCFLNFYFEFNNCCKTCSITKGRYITKLFFLLVCRSQKYTKKLLLYIRHEGTNRWLIKPLG